MGDSEEGGGGSVYWKLEAKDVGPGQANHNHTGKNVKQGGKDDDEKAEPGYHFTVSVLKRNGMDGGQFLAHLKSALTLDGDRVYFNHPIEDKKAQIRVSWGKSDYHKGTGGTNPDLGTRTTT